MADFDPQKIGILGDGQLGRMLAEAAARLGHSVVSLGPEPDSPLAQLAGQAIVGAYDDPQALERLIDLTDVITLEFENIPVATLEALEAMGARVFPGSLALSQTQDRLIEKQFIRDQGIATVDFVAVDSPEDIVDGLTRLGAPALLKTRREGYDGKGQVWVPGPDEAEAAFAALNRVPAILEARAGFEREVSIIAVRDRSGRVQAYDLGENVHQDGILATTEAPAPGFEALQAQAHDIAMRILSGLNYVGVAGIEFFVMPGALLWVNEIAPRVHNSGHWTQDGTVCDQFENHIRAVAGWPLGSSRTVNAVRMHNLLGQHMVDVPRWAADPEARLHLYGKSGARKGRKMGHVNIRL